MTDTIGKLNEVKDSLNEATASLQGLGKNEKISIFETNDASTLYAAPCGKCVKCCDFEGDFVEPTLY